LLEALQSFATPSTNEEIVVGFESASGDVYVLGTMRCIDNDRGRAVFVNGRGEVVSVKSAEQRHAFGGTMKIQNVPAARVLI